jgi:hypothetical protein
MSISSNKDRVRAEAAQEALHDLEVENRTEAKLRRWGFATLLSGVGLIASVAAAVPFLAGQALHHRWDPIGKNLVLLSMGLFLIFMFTGGITYTIWDYLRKMRAINRKYGPPKFRPKS